MTILILTVIVCALALASAIYCTALNVRDGWNDRQRRLAYVNHAIARPRADRWRR